MTESGDYSKDFWQVVENMLDVVAWIWSGHRRWNCQMSQQIQGCLGDLRIWYMYSRGRKYRHPYLINTIEMMSLWMEIKCIKSAARLLDRDWVKKGGLDLSKEVLWVSVGQRVAQLQAVKVGGQQKILPSGLVRTRFARAGPIGRIFCWPPTLTACSYATLWPTETHST